MTPNAIIFRFNQATGGYAIEEYHGVGLPVISVIFETEYIPPQAGPQLGWVTTFGSRRLRRQPNDISETLFAITDGAERLAVYGETVANGWDWWRVQCPEGWPGTLWIAKTNCGQLEPV